MQNPQIYYFFLRYKFCFKSGYWETENISLTDGDHFQIYSKRKVTLAIEHAVGKWRREGHGKFQELAASSEGNTTKQVLPLDNIQVLLENVLLKSISSRPHIILPVAILPAFEVIQLYIVIQLSLTMGNRDSQPFLYSASCSF